METLVNAIVKVETPWVDWGALIVLQVEPTYTFRTIYSSVLITLGVNPHRWIYTCIDLKEIALLAGEAIASLEVIRLAIRRDLIAYTIARIKAIATKDTVGLIAG